MKYEDMSDTEINHAVASEQFGDWRNNKDISRLITSKRIDYCNNPTDAWPIIVANRISTAFDSNTAEWFCWGDFEFDQGGWYMITEPAMFHSHYNPLRAAMVVFLKMQEKA